jgi:hypothetical protein
VSQQVQNEDMGAGMRLVWFAFILGLGLANLPATAVVAMSAQQSLQVPLKMSGNAAPVVIVRIQDREIPLQLDIGDGSSLVLHPSLLRQLKTTPTVKSFDGIGMEGKAEHSPIVNVDRVYMGGAIFSNVAIREDVHDDAFRNKQLAETGAQGFVGAGFFADYEIVLNYRQHRMTLIPRGAQQTSHLCRGNVIPLVREVNWGLVTRANTDVGDLLFVWDTGSPALLIRKTSALAAGLDVSQRAVTLNHVRMDNHDYGPLKFDIWDFPAPAAMAGVIGHDFFIDHVVCVDFPENRLLVR